MKENIKINITDDTPKIIHEMMSVRGELYLGDKKHDLIMPVEHWSTQDYEQQWKKGLQKIENEDVSCIVTRVLPIRTIDWYLLYKKGGKVHVYRYFLVAEDYDAVIGDKKFTPKNCYDFIPSFAEFQKIHDREFAIEEWEVDIKDLQDAKIIFPE